MSALYAEHLVLIQQTAVSIILALSFQIALASGLFSVACAGLYGVGGYLTADLVLRAPHLPLVGLLAAVIGASALISAGLGLMFGRLRGLYLAMATVAFNEILYVAALNGGSWTGGAQGLFGVYRPVSTWLLYLVVIVCVISVSQVERRRMGRAFQALRTDEMLANSIGINISRQRIAILIASGVLGGIAGSLNVLTTGYANSDLLGFPLVVSGLTMVVIGGMRSWLGAVIGAVIVVWFAQATSSLQGYQELVYGVLLTAIVVYEPGGVVGIGGRAIRAARQKWWRRGPENSSSTGDTSDPASDRADVRA